MNNEKEVSTEIEFFTRMGVEKFNEQIFEEAVEFFDKALLLSPDDANLYNLRAHARFSLGDSKGAKQDFNRSKRLKSKSKKFKTKKKAVSKK